MSGSPGPVAEDGSKGARGVGAAKNLGGIPEGIDIHRLLIASVRDYAIFVLDATGHIATWNIGAERLKGYTAEEAIGHHFSIFYPPEDIERGHPEYELAVAVSEGRYAEEGWRLRKDGSRFWASVTITALRADDGTLVGFAKVTRDLTELKHAQDALQRSEKRFRLLVENVIDYGIFMLDPEGRVASWNEGAQRIKGYASDEILGCHFSIFYPPEDLQRNRPETELRAATADGRFEDEGWRIRKDGTRFWANVVITALRNPAGELVGFAKLTRDLTERREAELKSIQDARRVAEAEAANRAKSEFLAAMSHELRTPLNAIAGYVDLLTFGVHGALNEAQLEALDRVRKSQHHLLTLINDLLNFTRIEAGRVTYDLAPVDLAKIAGTVVDLVHPQAEAKEIAIRIRSDAESVVAIADRARVEQILLNLLTNAVKYTGSKGHIIVDTVRRGDLAVLEVSDTGVGIAPESVESIFEPFTQLGRSLTSPHEGAGLGLAISRDLARAMNGDLTVRSTVGEGSTFTLELPGATD